MTTIKRMVGTAIGFVMVAAFSTGIIVLVLSLASKQVPGIKTIGEELRCIVGVPDADSPCIAEQLAALDEERQGLEAERDAFARTAAEHAAREAELEALNNRVENYSQFQTVKLSVGTIQTGVRFASVLQPEVWSEAWCYLDRTVQGLPRKITLGKRSAGQLIRWSRVSQAQLHDADLTRAQLEEAKSACRFPEGTR